MEQLKEYNGTGPEGRVLVAVNGKVFDVTKGKRFYGPGGPYAAFAGRDASRGLASFSVAASEEYDDLSDLNAMQKESVKEWETQFTKNMNISVAFYGLVRHRVTIPMASPKETAVKKKKQLQLLKILSTSDPPPLAPPLVYLPLYPNSHLCEECILFISNYWKM